MTGPETASPASPEDAVREARDASGAGSAPARNYTPPTTGTEPVSRSDWRDGLDPALGRIAAKFATPEAALRSYAALEKRLGRSVVVPGNDAPANEVEAFYTRLGRPNTPADYDVTLAPELRADGGEEAARDFFHAMHRAGATGPVVQAALDWYVRALKDAQGAVSRRAEEKAAEGEAALRRDWGAEYDRRVAGAQRAADRFGGEELSALLEEAGLSRHPVIVKTLAAIAAATAEATLVSPEGGDDGTSPRRRIDRLMAEHYGKPSYVSAAVQGELRTLYRDLYGDESVDPSSR